MEVRSYGPAHGHGGELFWGPEPAVQTHPCTTTRIAAGAHDFLLERTGL